MPYNSFFTNNTELSPVLLEKFLALPSRGKVLAEYVWLGGEAWDMRCKSRTLDTVPEKPEDLPWWNYDGSSTGQAPGHDSEVLLKPVAIFPDPFRGAPHIMVLCENYLPNGEPLALKSGAFGNTRKECNEIMEKVKGEECWFGIEQEYTLFEADGKTPFGWPKNGYCGPQGPYYCSAGYENAFGRAVMESHYAACIYAGIKIGGVNGEVMPGQWEYQIGPCVGIEEGDHLWMSRYVMMRVCELFGVVVSFHPKPMKGDWNGAGCHTNFSTKAMREDGGYDVIIAALEKMKAPGKQEEHIKVYGTDNEQRLTGKHETASIKEFTYGVANRGCSARIPRTTEADKKGYFEDRRPASNCDPYLVTMQVVKTCVLNM
jgi:glutamine synthetase